MSALNQAAAAAVTALARPAIRALQPYQPGKPVSELQRELGISEIIKLASNENPLGPSARALAAAQAALSELTRYPDGSGFALKAALAERHAVDLDRITLGSGSSELLELIARVLLSADDEVIHSQHAFLLYPLITQIAGGRSVVVPAQDWGHDLDAMAAAVGERTKLIYIANPNNPTGTWVGRAALQRFLDQVPSRVVVVLDEAYYEYAAAADVDYPSDTIDWIDRYPNLMVTRTFSKGFGLAALRVGYAICQPALADLLNRVRPPFNVTSVGLAAAAAVLEDSDYLQRSIAINRDGLAQLFTGFAQLGLPAIRSIGNFIAVDMGQPAAPLYQQLLQAGVIVRPIAGYEMPHHLRVSVGLPAENARLLTALAPYSPHLTS